jgi:transcriptional regulator with XRE-family HTH domain
MIPSGNIFTDEAVHCVHVRDRPTYYKDFAAFLVELRTARKWRQSRAVAEAHRKGLTAITRQILIRMEKGQVKDPDVEVLRQLAVLYKQDEHAVLQRLLLEKYSDLVRHAEGLPSTSSTAQTPHLEGTADAGSLAAPRTPVDVLTELAAAVVGFAELAERASEWSNRLADLVLASQVGLDVTHAQVTVARVTTSHSGPDVREDGGQSHRQDRPRSA